MANTGNQNKPHAQTNLGQGGPQGSAGTVEQARDTLAAAGDRARDALSSAGDKARSAAASVAQSAGEAVGTLGHRAEDAAGAVGSGLKSLGDQVRQNAPQGGVLGQASSRVADTLEHTGQYLQEEGLQGLADDVATMIRRNPIPALLVGLGVGFLVARALTPRS